MADVNSFLPAAFSIDGARHPGELLRAFAYAATGGREGVVISSDCRVEQLSTAGPQIAILPGALSMRNRSAGAVNQSYVAFNRALSFLDVGPTGGSARSDLVIVRPKDPQYSPWQSVVGANDPETFQYVEPIIIQNVPATTTSAAQLNLGYSAYAVARLDIPPGTTNITKSMIRDLRTLIQPAHDPKEARTVRVWQPTAQQAADLVATNLTRIHFPKLNESIFCPAWATRATLLVTVNSLKFHGERCFGNIQAEYGWNNDETLLATEPSGFHHEDDVPAEDDSRQTIIMAGTFAIPASFRGKSHFVRTGGVMDSTRSNDAKVTLDRWSTVIVDMQFEETAD